MFIYNHYYTPEQIISLKNEGDTIFIDGLLFLDEQLVSDFSGIHLRYYRSTQESNGTISHMFTLCG